jgi:hypothetical protein
LGMSVLPGKLVRVCSFWLRNKPVYLTSLQGDKMKKLNLTFLSLYVVCYWRLCQETQTTG